MSDSHTCKDFWRSPLYIFAAAAVFLLWLGPRNATAFAGGQDQQAAANPAPAKTTPVRLEAGKPVEKELAGGAGDSYEVVVGAGQFLHVTVDQMGIDVALTLSGPDGKQIAMMDSPNGFYGPEQISTVAEAQGAYRLEIASGDKSVATGRYRVSIDPLRAPTDADLARIQAERLFMDAGTLYIQGGADSLRQAAEKYEGTVPLWRRAHDTYEEGLALNAIGDIHGSFGENQKALEYYNQSLPLRRAVGDRDGEAWTLNSIGVVYDQFGEKQQALAYYNQALPLQRAVGNLNAQVATLSNAGSAYSDLGEKQKALGYYLEALPLERKAGNRYWEAGTLSNIGRVYEDLGEKQKALEYYNQALPLSRAVGDRDGESRALNNIGKVYGDLGDSKQELDYFNQALTLERAVGSRVSEACTLGNIGVMYDALGEHQKALDYYNQALPLDRAAGDRLGESLALNNIGAAYLSLGEKKLALENYTQALALARAVQMPQTQAVVLNNLRDYWRKEGQPAIAIFFGKQAVNEIQQVRANLRGLEKEEQQSFVKSNEKTYRMLADLLITQGRLPEAQQVLDLLKNEEYFSFIRRDGKEATSLTASVTLTKTEEALNREYEANAARVTAAGNEWAALRSKPNRTPEEEKHLAELSAQLKSANDAWGKFLSGLYAELGKSKEAQATVQNVQESASGMQRVVRQLNREAGAGANANAGGGVVALYTLVGEEKYRVIVVTPTVMVAREYPIKAEYLREKVFDFRQALMNPKSNPVPKAQELYRILVGPVEQDLAGAQAGTLMWSLDDALRYLPIAALHDGREYLVEKYRNEVFTPASIASLAERPDVSAWRGLGMGVSKSYGDFSALPAVPEELHRIIREKDSASAGAAGGEGVLPGQMMLDEAFTEANLKKALEQNYPLVHIASHFDFEAGNETDSFLLLGGEGAQGERLTLAEMRNDPAFNFADTQLLTLSACNTAVSGATGDGREVDGLGILAQQKGARAVMASLWGVFDPSTGVLMQKFYSQWTTHPDMTKGEALRQAQLALLRGSSTAAGANSGEAASGAYSHPYYWAPFILIGNWR